MSLSLLVFLFDNEPIVSLCSDDSIRLLEEKDFLVPSNQAAPSLIFIVGHEGGKFFLLVLRVFFFFVSSCLVLSVVDKECCPPGIVASRFPRSSLLSPFIEHSVPTLPLIWFPEGIFFGVTRRRSTFGTTRVSAVESSCTFGESATHAEGRVLGITCLIIVGKMGEHFGMWGWEWSLSW